MSSGDTNSKSQTTNLTDHRDIGQALDLFSFHSVAPGTVFWHGNGMIIWRELEKYLREKLDTLGYQEVSTPIMVKKELFEKSGHWQHYRENMFTLDVDDEIYVLKPMNCPESTLIYSSRVRSYRDLPIRMSEITDKIHRKELSGTLGGLLRVRQMTQDDAHHYVRPDQIGEEVSNLLDLIKEFYSHFNMSLSFNLATKPDNSMGDPNIWSEAEKDLESVLKKAKVKYQIKEKDGAFYGPKVDINATDSQNREWTIATIQLDFQLPERFELEYVAEDGSKKRPVIIHRAIAGSFERFIGVLLEHTEGKLPTWLSPTQAIIMPISEKQTDYAKKVFNNFKKEDIRVQFNNSSETISKRIREAELQKIPYILVVGEKEEDNSNISVRQRSVGDIGAMQTEEILKKIKKEITDRI
ncbi:MAG: threonine--tRNA ligase [Parcubacteria group bacterium]|nr:threonine--tRNA ligase [Parcubacteria group bacterium]